MALFLLPVCLTNIVAQLRTVPLIRNPNDALPSSPHNNAFDTNNSTYTFAWISAKIADEIPSVVDEAASSLRICMDFC